MDLVSRFDGSKGWDFGFLRGLAQERLDEFSSRKYEKKRESFGHSPAKLESGEMRFSGEILPRHWSRSKISFYPCPSIKRHSKQRTRNLQIAQNTTSEAKELQYIAGKIIQRLFSIGPCTYLSIYGYRRSER